MKTESWTIDALDTLDWAANSLYDWDKEITHTTTDDQIKELVKDLKEDADGHGVILHSSLEDELIEHRDNIRQGLTATGRLCPRR